MRNNIWILFAAFLCPAAQAFSLNDPLSVQVPPRPCRLSEPEIFTLDDVVAHALCANPQTREAWANARAQAAQVGIAESAYLPTLNATVNSSLNRNSSILSRLQGAGNAAYSQTATGFTLSQLLYDFGGRRAALDNAGLTLKALNETRDAVMQTVFLAAVQGYYQLFASQAALEASVEAERSSLESLAAATTRSRVGTATPADALQAKTAYRQAVLNRITASGNEKAAQGTLANAMGYEAGREVRVAGPRDLSPDDAFPERVEALMEKAKRKRPDLLAARDQLDAAKADVRAAEATGMPNIAFTLNQNYTHSSIFNPYQSTSAGLALNFPIFTGFNTTYRTRQAEARVEASEAQVEKLSNQITLDVWRAYQNLSTATETLKSTEALLESAIQSEQVALGRYKAGVGTIVDLLGAQSALASARQERVQAVYTWQIDKAALAQAIGILNRIPEKK